MKRLLAILSVSACAPLGNLQPEGPCPDWAVSSDFDDRQFGDIKAGAELWNTAAGRVVVSVSRGNRDTCRVIRGPNDPSLAGARGAQEITLFANALHDDDACWTQVSAHEFGHALGMSHVDQPAVMAVPANCVPVLQPNDIAACEAVNVCRPKE